MNVDDLEIFILTYNRADFLKDTLLSLKNQTISGFKVTVLDNGSTDNTKDLVTSFSNDNVFYDGNQKNLGVYKNMEKAQLLCEKKWVMLFHDDDIMHPNYIENVIEVINNNQGLALVGSLYKTFFNKEDIIFTKPKKDFIHCKNVSLFAANMYNNIPYAFCSAIYRADIFKGIKIRDKEFGKILDTPMLLDTAKNGESIIFNFPFIHYRLHMGRDSIDSKSGPFEDEVLNLNKEYLKHTGSSIFTKSGRIFLLKNFPYVLDGYTWIGKDFKGSIVRFIFNGLKNKSLTICSLIVGLLLFLPRTLKKRISR